MLHCLSTSIFSNPLQQGGLLQALCSVAKSILDQMEQKMIAPIRPKAKKLFQSLRANRTGSSSI
jgi:hypothetical protein